MAVLVFIVLLLLGGCGGSDEQTPAEQNALDISVFGEGDIHVQGDFGQIDCARVTMCEGMFNQGDEVVLVAEPDSGWDHDSWIGCDRQDAPDRCTVFIDSDRLVSVTFLSDDPLEFDTDVIVLRNDQFQGLINYDLSTGRLAFNATTDGASQWAIGTILLGAENPDEGITLARRITGIESAGSRIVFRTEQASLQEIFRSGSFSDYGTADAGSRESFGPITAQDDDYGTPITINVDLVSGVKAGGWIRYPVEKQLAVNFSPDFEFRLIALVKPTASIGLDISRSISISAEKELLSKSLGKIPIPTPLSLPIFVSPTLKLFVAGEAEASAALGIGVSISVSATAGVHYKDGELNPIFKAEVDPMYTVSNGVDFDLNWDAEIRARSELHFNLLGVAGPFVGVAPYFGIMSGCGDDFAETYKGWLIEIGGSLKAIGGPRLAIPAYDSSRITQMTLPLSRMPSSEEVRCSKMPDETPSAVCYGLSGNMHYYERYLTCYNPDSYEGVQQYKHEGSCVTRQSATSQTIPLCPTWGPEVSGCDWTESDLLNIGLRSHTCPG